MMRLLEWITKLGASTEPSLIRRAYLRIRFKKTLFRRLAENCEALHQIIVNFGAPLRLRRGETF
jgi:hypothetical protein